jgi:rod shape-determining protein MreB
MSILRNFFTDDLAIDLGTVNTLIYAPERGIVLNEPSAVALDKYTHEVLSVGSEAYKLLGREPQDTEVHRPIRGGTIDEFEITRKMLAAFINRVHGPHHKRLHLVVGVPSSSTGLEQRSVKDAARDTKAARIDLVNEGLAAALGAGLDFENEHARLIVDIGGGTTNVAVVASGAVVSSVSLHAAGRAMDEAVRDFVRAKFAMQIGERTAEQVKKDLGSAFTSPGALGGDKDRRMELVGKDLSDGMAKAVEISEAEVSQALQPVLSEIISGVRRAIEESAPEVTADIHYSGIILTGGGALLKGMPERLQNELRLHVTLADDPLAAVVLGAGRLLTEPAKLQRVSIRHDIPVWQASEELVVNW